MTRFRRPNTVETTALVAGVLWWPLFKLGDWLWSGADVMGRAQVFVDEEDDS